jgi:hypothetical protein
MGLFGCPATFPKLVVTKIRNVITIHLQNHDEHLQILESWLADNGLKLVLEECKFGSKEVVHPGFHLTENGIKHIIDKFKEVKEAKLPSSVHQVIHFLGLFNFFGVM